MKKSLILLGVFSLLDLILVIGLSNIDQGKSFTRFFYQHYFWR
ncbi:MAG: hypothetical protein RR266_01195 [Bacilli bacterium]